MKHTKLYLVALLAVAATVFSACEKLRPEINATFTDVKDTEVEAKITPNEGVSEYAYLFARKGEATAADVVEKGKKAKGETTDRFKQLTPETDYELIVVPSDIDGRLAEMKSFEVRTSVKQPVPAVDAKFTNVTAREVTVEITKNELCKKYHYMIMEKGEMANQLAMFGAMFGIDNEADYLRAFGGNHLNDTVHNYTKMDPGQDWELYVLPVGFDDKDGDVQVFECTTKKLGGPGEASVTIEIGKWEYEIEKRGEQGLPDTVKYFQTITVAPNDQASLFRYFLVTKEYYDKEWGEQKVLEYLKSENNPNWPPEYGQDPYWNIYETDEWPWGLVPETEYYVFAIAKNINDEYGPLASKLFKTPEGIKDGGEEGGETPAVQSLPRKMVK